MKICFSVFGHIAFSAKQWNLSENSKSQIAIRLEDVTESVKATDIEAFIKEETSSQIVRPIIDLLGKQISHGSRINSSLKIMTMFIGVVPHHLQGLSQGFWKFIEHKGGKFEIIQILDLVRLQPGHPLLEFHYRNKE